MIIQRVARGTALNIHSHPDNTNTTELSQLEFAAPKEQTLAQGVVVDPEQTLRIVHPRVTTFINV